MTRTQLEFTKTTNYFPVSIYHSLTNILKTLSFDQKTLHVFSTGTLSKKLSKMYHFNLTNISSMEQKLFGNFNTAQTKIYLQAILRDELMNGHYEYRENFLHRLSSLVETYYVIAEFGLNDLNIETEDLRAKETIRLLNRLLSDPVTEQYFLTKRTLTKEDVSLKLCNHENLQTIIFYEIDYLNFVRMNFIHWLKNNGFQIEFRIPYNKNFPKTYEFWKNVYQVVTNGQIDESLALDDEQLVAVKFGSFNEGILPDVDEQKNIEIIEFPSPNDFKHYYHTYDDLTFAVDFNNISTIVYHDKQNIYEDENSKFLYYIQFCKKVNGSIQIDYDNFIELMTTDWIYTDDVSGSQSLSLLKDLEEYMSGIETIDDIIERLKRIQSLELVSRTFDQENSIEAGRNNFKRYMLNPFRVFAILQRDRYEVSINQLLNLTHKLNNVCQNLILEDAESINVNEYFLRWKNFIHDSACKNNELILQVFSEKLPDNWSFSTPELLSLIYLLMDRLHDFSIDIYPLSRIQEFLIHDEITEPIHITNLTLFNFPETHKTPISEFFDHTALKELVQLNINNKKAKNILLHSLWVDYVAHDQFESLGIYYLHNVLAHFDGLIKFSWIDQLEENGIRNIFLDILADLYTSGTINVYEAELKLPEFAMVDQIDNKNRQSFDTALLKGRIPDLYWLDHDFCAKKFFLTTFIEQQPIYDSEFHYNFVFSKIGKLLSYSKYERDIFRKLIYPLFPHWTFTKKENLIDMEYIISLTDYKHFENISYPREIRGIQTLRGVYRENRRTRARNQYRRDSNYNENKLLKQFSEYLGLFNVKAESGNHCKMCPHLSSCIEGMYSIDNINR